MGVTKLVKISTVDTTVGRQKSDRVTLTWEGDRPELTVADNSDSQFDVLTKGPATNGAGFHIPADGTTGIVSHIGAIGYQLARESDEIGLAVAVGVRQPIKADAITLSWEKSAQPDSHTCHLDLSY